MISENCIIYNCDEMPCYFDTPYNSTYGMVGSSSVPLKTTGHEKTRFTLMLCAANDGRKCTTAIIFKGLKKVPKKQEFSKGIHIMVSEKGSMTTSLINQWRSSVGQKTRWSFPQYTY